MGSCLSISIAMAYHYQKRTCFSCRRVLKKNRDKYVSLQDKNVCNKCIDSNESD